MAGNGLSENKQQEMLLKERKANSAWNKLRRNKSAMLGLVMIVFVILVSIFGPFLMVKDPAAMDFINMNAKPGTAGFPLGSGQYRPGYAVPSGLRRPCFSAGCRGRYACGGGYRDSYRPCLRICRGRC